MIHEDYIDCPGYHRLSLTAMLAVDHNEGMLEETSGNTTYDSDDNDGDGDMCSDGDGAGGACTSHSDATVLEICSSGQNPSLGVQGLLCIL
jgi:hypothetical protein